MPQLRVGVAQWSRLCNRIASAWISDHAVFNSTSHAGTGGVGVGHPTSQPNIWQVETSRTSLTEPPSSVRTQSPISLLAGKGLSHMGGELANSGLQRAGVDGGFSPPQARYSPRSAGRR